jgi:hypothetical protein
VQILRRPKFVDELEMKLDPDDLPEGVELPS